MGTDGGPTRPAPRRRTVVAWLGALGAGAVAAGSACTPPRRTGTTVASSTGPTASADGPWTLERWRRERGEHYLVAHRGSGDVVPEHTLEAYAAALAWGARCLEVSVCRTADGVLVCNHDLTLDRTTDLTGPVAARTMAELDAGRVDVPRLGPRWQGPGRPRIARLDAALDLVGTRAVLCLEAKDDAAFPDLLEVVRRRGLAGRVVVKVHGSSARLEQARAARLPVFAYLGSAAEVTPDAIDALAARLDARTDVLVLPAFADGGVLTADDLVQRAVGTGVDVWVHPLHRRSEVAHFAALGVRGSLAASYGYLAGTAASSPGAWPGDALRPGTLTRFPDSDRFGLTWPEAGVVTLGLAGEQQFVTVAGTAAPGARPTRLVLDVEVRLDATPGPGPEDLFAVSVGHDDDRYVDLSGADVPGHHVVLGTDGSLSVTQGGGTRRVVARAEGPALVPGQWVPLRLEVRDGTLTCGRPDAGTGTTAPGVSPGAGIVHLGRVPRLATVSVRGLTTTLS